MILAPGPGIAKPQSRQNSKPGRFRPPIVHGNANKDVFRTLLRVLQKHIKISAFAEDSRIDQLIFKLVPRPFSIRFDQVPIRIFPLRVLVEILHVRVSRRGVDVEVILLHILAVVRFVVGESVQALLEDGIMLIP